jgi:hypothetical protein
VLATRQLAVASAHGARGVDGDGALVGIVAINHARDGFCS